MKNLVEYVLDHTERGACCCGKCIDAPPNPATLQPQGHTANVEFFEVSARNEPDAKALRTLIKENYQGSFANVDLFDGKEHNYLELGGWIGDQGSALTLMGLGSLLGLWRLLTPSTVLGDSIPKDLAMQMAGMGMVAIQSEKASVEPA